MNRDFRDGECRRKGAGTIMLDSETTLAGVPAEVRDYKLGNRSALKWVLDPHKEKTPLALKGGRRNNGKLSASAATHKG